MSERPENRTAQRPHPPESGSAPDRPTRKGRRVLLNTPRALQLPACVRPAKRVLAPGMAPACLRRGLQQQSNPPRKLVTTCDWLEKPAPRLHLLPTPLFGTCLDDVLKNPRPANQDEERDLPREEIPLPDWRADPEKGKRITNREAHAPVPVLRPPSGRTPHNVPSIAPHAAHAKAEPFAHPAQASPELLARRAGGNRSVSLLAARKKSAKWPAPFFSPAVRAAVHTPPRVSPPGLQPTAFSAAAVRSEWLIRLSRRLLNRFSTPTLLPVHLASASNGGSHAKGIDETPGQTEKDSGWVARAAAVDPTGPTAPLELLLRLIGAADLPEKEAARRAPPVQDEKPASSAPPKVQSQTGRAASGAPDWDTPFTATARGETPPVGQPPPGAKQGFYPQSGSLPLPAAGQPHFRPPLAPPLVSETPPTLHPPQEVFDAPTPFAAAAARRTAKFDDAYLVEEDLDVLASKIKRILDDEARRYGIQVD